MIDDTAEKRAALARLLEQKAAEGPQPQPLAIAQEQLWFVDRLDPGTALYTIPMTMRLRGSLDTGALERSLGETIRRQSALRITFGVGADGLPYQIVGPYVPVSLPVIDAASETEAHRLAVAEARRPFDLEQGPLVRFQLLRLHPTEHWLQVTVHHIIADGISIGVIFRELAEFYGACTEGRTAVLPDLPVSYCTFARRQRAELQGGVLKPQLAYWRQKLAGQPAFLPLPTDRPRPAVRSFKGDTLITHLPVGLMEHLKALSRCEGVTQFMILLAVLKVLLYRYTWQGDIAVGTPIAGRPSADVEGLVGLFANTLVLRSDLTGLPTFRQFLHRVRVTALEAYAHQAVPFSKLVEELRPERSLSVTPLFQVMFGLETSLAELQLPGLVVEQVWLDSGTSKFDLSLYINDCDCYWEYSTDLFDAGTVQRMGAQFTRLLEAVVRDPDQPVDALPLLPEAERHQVLEQFGTGPTLAYPRERGVHHLIVEQASRTPERIALVCGETAWTYAELDGRANRLARYLGRLGVGVESLVGIAVERSPELIVAMLGVLKAGGAYVPMDPGYPAERLAYMQAEAGVAVVLTQEHLKDSLPPGAVALCLDSDWPTITLESAEPFEGGAGPENLAYVIFTSGSTGRPKGVQVPHRGLTNVTAWTVDQHHLGADDAVLAITPISFDIAAVEIYPPLISGGKVVLAERGAVVDGARLAAMAREHRVTLIQATPVTFRVLLSAGWQSHPGLTLVVGGELVTRELADQIMAGGGALFNVYGPTETTVWSTCWRVEPAGVIAIGRPVANTQCYILDHRLEPVPVGAPGELYIGGDGLARGYLNRPDLTAERFVASPYGRIYRTGDQARWLPSGQIEYLGRLDHQVKIRGFRIEPGEIESVLQQHPSVSSVVVVPRENAVGERGLVAYYTAALDQAPTVAQLRAYMRDRLPEYMIPTVFQPLAELPLTPNGKVDRRALPAPEEFRTDTRVRYEPPVTDLEKRVAAIWQVVLGGDRVGLHDNFFDLGGSSLRMVQVHTKLRETLKAELSVVELFRYPTVSLLAGRLRGATHDEPVAKAPPEGLGIAIVGMAGRFPGAWDVDQFWSNLQNGVHSIRRFSRDELTDADPNVLDDPAYVPAKGYLEGGDLFDAGFFGMTPREAETVDPQQRIFLEVAWTALEHAGHDPGRFPGRIGVYAGAGFNSYLMTNLAQNPTHLANVGMYQVFLGNDKDFLATRAAYKLNLTGPAVGVQTACSTSLVAIHHACQALRAGDCDMALAGGAAVTTPLKDGYLYQPGLIKSPDGFCRAFDEQAAGTLVGNGVAAVVLKRLNEAIRDGDTIHAVIRGSAINNDGLAKIGFTAPSSRGQAQVIAEAMSAAGIGPDTIGYVEAHGTGTELGDPIEMDGLIRAFRSLGAEGRQYCAVGSVKTNVGHLDAAAGVAGVIKAALAVKYGRIPPSLHYRRPNPRIDFESSPFYVADKLQDWPLSGAPRRAGVSSFGIGGTNVHAVLEEAPAVPPSGPGRQAQLLVLSARSPGALDRATENLSRYLASHGDVNLADVAYTLSVGRTPMAHRRMVLARDAADAVQTLATPVPEMPADRAGGVAFLFPGQGAQYSGMARELYETEPIFRAEVDRCCALLNFDLREVIWPAEPDERLSQTAFTQPALFIIEYAMAKLWMAWGVEPKVMIGHSLGEYVAACLAGVFTLEDGLKLVTARGRMIQALPGGAMLAVFLPEREVEAMLPPGLSIAAINGPAATVVAGPHAAIGEFQAQLDKEGLVCRRLQTSHAFHSAMMEPMLGAYEALVRSVKLSPPRIPFISNVTGTLISPSDATSPQYWVQQIRSTVRFAAGVHELFADPDLVLLEVGPGQTLIGLARLHLEKGAGRVLISSDRQVKDRETDVTVLLGALGRLWLAGIPVDWNGVYDGQQRCRLPLPTYPFERQRYWVEPLRCDYPNAAPGVGLALAAEAAPAADVERSDLAEEYAAPTTKLENAITVIWQSVLGVGRVGIHDNFFELGGDSLVASRVITRLREQFPVIEVPFSVIFEAPTVAQLGALLEERLMAKLESMSDEEAEGVVQ